MTSVPDALDNYLTMRHDRRRGRGQRSQGGTLYGVIGCGNAGITLSAMLAAHGYEVISWEDPAFTRTKDAVMRDLARLEVVDHTRSETLSIPFSSLHFTANIDEIANCKILFQALPIPAHDAIFERLARVWAKGIGDRVQFVNLVGGFSVFQHLSFMAQRRLELPIDMATFHTLPFACRVSRGSAHLINVRARTTYAWVSNASGSSNFENGPDLIGGVFDALVERDDSALHCSIDRSSYFLHPAITVFNQHRVGDNGFRFYADGLSPNVQQIILSGYRERANLTRALGYQDFLEPEERLAQFLTSYGDDFRQIRGPATFRHRFITEDIPFGLAPTVTLGEHLGVDMPMSRGLVATCSALVGRDLRDSPYDLRRNRTMLDTMMAFK